MRSMPLKSGTGTLVAHLNCIFIWTKSSLPMNLMRKTRTSEIGYESTISIEQARMKSGKTELVETSARMVAAQLSQIVTTRFE